MGGKPSQSHQSPAGASAVREYDRRRAARRARARKRFGAGGALLVRLAGEPQTRRAWKQGAQAEAQVAAALARHLRGHNVRLLNDRRIPGRGRANIDHLAIGPGGVTVIDTKSTHGRLSIKRTGGLLSAQKELLVISGRDCTPLLDGLERQVAAVRQLLNQRQLEHAKVQGALCCPNAEGIPLLGALQSRDAMIAIDRPRGSAKLDRRPGPLAPKLIERVAGELASALPTA